MNALRRIRAKTGKDRIMSGSRKIPQGALSEDQKIAAKIEIKPHPKSKISDLRKVLKAVRSILS